MARAALKYAARGWHVFPLHSPRDGKCSCGKVDCTSPAKHPRTSHGLKDATIERGQILEWWRQWPDANIGIANGSVAGIVVLDIDVKKGGLDSLVELQGKYGHVDTLTSCTGGGGRHLILQCPSGISLKSSTSEIAPGIDTRAEGGYIVAPPSRHISGKLYWWEG